MAATWDMAWLVCEVCRKPIIEGQYYVHHQRLNVDVHLDCPRDNVKGEDITGHTVLLVKREE